MSIHNLLATWQKLEYLNPTLLRNKKPIKSDNELPWRNKNPSGEKSEYIISLGVFEDDKCLEVMNEFLAGQYSLCFRT